jgi:multidrug efflux pump subunit AcrB
VNGVDEIHSSVREGNSSTTVTFLIGTPIDRATNDVRDAVTQIRGDLPEGILEPQVARQDFGQQLAIFAVQTSDMTLEQLSWYIDNQVAKRLLAVPGMAGVDRYGGVNREIRVVLNPAAIEAQGITAAQVNQQLRQINVDSAGGRAEIAGSEQAVRVLGNAETAADLAATQISLPGGRTARLGDPRAGRRRQQRATFDQQARRQADRQLCNCALEGRFGRDRLQRCGEGAAQDRGGQRRQDQVQRNLHRGRVRRPRI